MDYRHAKKVNVGDTLLIKPRNYRSTTVLEITEDETDKAIFFRCTDGLFYHDAVVPAMSADALAKLYLRMKTTRVFINHNNDLGEWLFSVEVADSGGFWLASFDTLQEAEAYIDAMGLKSYFRAGTPRMIEYELHC